MAALKPTGFTGRITWLGTVADREAAQSFAEPGRLRQHRRGHQQAREQHHQHGKGAQRPSSPRHGQNACPMLKWMRQRRGSGSPLTSSPSTRVIW